MCNRMSGNILYNKIFLSEIEIIYLLKKKRKKRQIIKNYIKIYIFVNFLCIYKNMYKFIIKKYMKKLLYIKNIFILLLNNLIDYCCILGLQF